MKALSVARNLRHAKNDPFGFIVDSLIKIVVNLIIPIPLAGDVVAKFKGPILGFIASIVMLTIMLFVTFIAIFSTIFLSPTGFFKYVSATVGENLNGINEEFAESTVPSQNPFGGSGMSYTSVTAGFMDPSYFLQFGKNHTGIDLIPNSTYYAQSNSYKENHKVIIYATHSGTASTYTDSEGGETVDILNDNGDLKTKYIHFKDIFINSNSKVQAGTALGEMGSTGVATGEHLHYEIQIKDSSVWKLVNPLSYIK